LETLAYSEGIAAVGLLIVALSLDARQEPSDGEGWTKGWPGSVNIGVSELENWGQATARPFP
jgi:hypothetical protein